MVFNRVYCCDSALKEELVEPLYKEIQVCCVLCFCMLKNKVLTEC